MFQSQIKVQLAWPTFIVAAASLATCLLWPMRPSNDTLRHDANRPESPRVVDNISGSANSVTQKQQLSGEPAHRYLKQTSDGQSLMQAVTAERFGLKLEERDPLSEAGSVGYLGMSHDQNLNVWFDDEGATIRPTTSAKERAQAWHLGLRLQAYGYGSQMQLAPPIVSHIVKSTRIEYRRADDFGVRNSEFGLMANPYANPQSALRTPPLVEWYENRSEGIEQGFTINERLVRSSEVAVAEPLRVSLAVSGDLRARAKGGEEEIELVSGGGKPIASYGKLTAVDANNTELAARMEVSADGRKIDLVVDDQNAVYPIVIDPIVASLQKKLEAFNAQQTDARFGFAVAISGDRAVVGAWREDIGSAPDVGVVYTLLRAGGAWSVLRRISGNLANDSCGWSVAISGSRLVYGCPGANSQSGRAFAADIDAGSLSELKPLVIGAGDQFGYSVAVSGNLVLVGAPFNNSSTGRVHLFATDGSDSALLGSIAGANPNEQFGTSVAEDGSSTAVVGAPGYQSGRGRVVEIGGATLLASDGEAGDNFGNSIDLIGNTMVIGAFGDDDMGTDAGAAYVFARAANGNWSQQQKLTVDDGRPGDHFSEHAVAIENGTIVVGAGLWDRVVSGDNAGAAYIFTHNGTTWTRQTALFGDPAENFGISVDISGTTVLVGARGSDASGTPRAGAAYAYLLDCLPARIVTSPGNKNVCEGGTFAINFSFAGGGASGNVFQIQWRKNGVNIPGANTAAYQIDHVSPADAGNYDVIVTNSCGSDISTPATLTVFAMIINPVSQNFSASGSDGIVNVTTNGSCAWTAVSNSSFITVSSGSSGSGNGTVGFTVAPNATSSQRTGTITIAGKTFTVTQDATALVSNVQFNATNYNVGEGADFATITVTRTGDTSGAATVDFATSDGSAQQRTDYTIIAGTLSFAPGDTNKTFSVLIVNDVYAEGNEALNLTLSNPTGGAVLGSPASATLTITDNDSGNSTTNPLDNAHFFVQQHYYDFLSRYPDQGGWDFWTAQVTQCAGDAPCARTKRIDVSNAFFYELEYQQTGAYVFRLYRVAFGSNQPSANPDNSNPTEARKLPSYSVFASDRARVVGGADLAAGQRNLATAFVQRGEFFAKYPASQDGPTFVDAVLSTIRNDAGIDLTSQRTLLINLFNSDGRGAVLYRLADDNISTNPVNNRSLIDEEYNRGFVFTEYAGYLRRDADIAGFLFWLGQVNSAPLRDTSKQHAMVCSFTTSAEYQQRFSLVVTHNNTECGP